MVKGFLLSKINWAAIILILIALKDAIANQDFSTMTWDKWAAFIIGILIIIFRTYFSGTDIKGAFTPKSVK